MRVNLNYNINMIKKTLVLITLLNTSSFAVETDPAKHTQGCYGKTTDCPQMTYHHHDGDKAIYLYQDYAGYWHIYGDDVHDLDSSYLSTLLEKADAQQNQDNLSLRNKFSIIDHPSK
jgi:hypothetical protein